MEQELKALKEQMDAQKKEMYELKQQNESLTSSKDEADSKLAEQKLETFRSEKLAVIQDDEIRGMIKEQLSGKTTEEIGKQFDKQVALYKKMSEKAGVKKSDIRILPTDAEQGDKELKFHDANEFFESKEISAKDKEEAFLSMLG